MKLTKLNYTVLLLALLAAFVSNILAAPVGTAFTYQGRLNNNSAPANGSYDFRFRLTTDPYGNDYVDGPVLTNGVAVNNGLFLVTLDFGSVFAGASYWLEVDVRTNGPGAYTVLFPLQPLTPTPYALMANSASNLLGTLPAAQLSGTVGNGQLANNSLTVNAGTGLSGGGTVALGGSTSLTANLNRDATLTGNGGLSTLGLNLGNANVWTALQTFPAISLPSTDASGNGVISLGGSSFLHAYGSENTFAGRRAGNLHNTGQGNTGIGDSALFSLTGGQVNTAVGDKALYSNTDGQGNTAIGWSTLYLNTTGLANTAVGCSALEATSGNFNTGIGYYALIQNTAGNYNTAIGGDALLYNTNGSYNTANGALALYNNKNGSNNNAFGYQALYSNTTGHCNTASGGQALYLNVSGCNNTANGYQALYSNTSGGLNTANGYGALYSNTYGYNNTAFGSRALLANTGGDNTAVGESALTQNTTGGFNTAIGEAALYSNTTGSDNTACGYDALGVNSTGLKNAAYGEYALIGNQRGSYNTASGYSALYSNTTGSNNIALGQFAGYNLTTGNYNIDIGNSGVAGEANIIRIGAGQTATYIAGISGVTISPSGGAVYVNANGQLGTVNSSRRFKEAIQDMASQSDILLALRPVAFHYKLALDPQLTPQYGLIAEEVEKVAPQLVLRDAKGEVLSVRYEQINAMLLNEFQKEHRKVVAQNSEIQELKQSVAELKAMVEELAYK